MSAKLSGLWVIGVFICLLTSPQAATADTVTGGQITAWNPNYLYGYPSYIPGLYYWNMASGDGPRANIGWCLIGGGECGMSNSPGALYFYSVSFTAPSAFYFSSNGHPSTAILRASVTDQKGVGNAFDIFGYYLADDAGVPILGTEQPMFTSNDPAGTNYTYNFATGQRYGFYIENVQGPNAPNQTTYLFSMNAASNFASGSMPADPVQHFSVFQTGSTFYLGANDANACLNGFQPGASPCVEASEFDYNDMIVELDTGTPEPASIALVSSGGLLLVGGLLRRRRRG